MGSSDSIGDHYESCPSFPSVEFFRSFLPPSVCGRTATSKFCAEEGVSFFLLDLYLASLFGGFVLFRGNCQKPLHLGISVWMVAARRPEQTREREKWIWKNPRLGAYGDGTDRCPRICLSKRHAAFKVKGKPEGKSKERQAYSSICLKR